MASLEAQRNPETDYKLKRVTEKFCESLHIMLNEPSCGLYRIQEHVRQSIPELVNKKNEMQSFHQKVEGMCYDVDYSIKTVKSMHNIQHFTIIQECLKSAIASKQNIEKAKLDRKCKKSDQETASSCSSEVPEVIEEDSVEVQGFICPICMKLWDSQDELLDHWKSHDFSDDDNDFADANPEEENGSKNEQTQSQKIKTEEEGFAHINAEESTLIDSSGLVQEREEEQISDTPPSWHWPR